jgi:serine-type D-Ala-D-Ala carboxypeptidase/endopeptidase (penicillin-binding protein 4)
MQHFTLLRTILVLFSFNTLLFASAPEDSSPLEQAFNDFHNDLSLEYAGWTVYVMDVTSGRSILEENIHKPLVPASVQKLVTTSTAIMMLGNDHQYETLLQHDGTVDRRGVLRGNLYIKGSGDPSFGSSQLEFSPDLDEVFAEWLNIIKRVGITTISGSIIADERIFDDEMVPRRWLWEHIGNYFGAGSSGLSVHENEYTVYFKAGPAIGSPAEVIDTKPEVPGMSFINEVTTGAAGSGDQVYIFGAPWVAERRLTGTVPMGANDFPVRGSMHDPPGFVADSFRNYLIENDIEVEGKSASYRTIHNNDIFVTDDRVNLSTHYSPLFFDIIYRTNLNSVNSYAENLLKSISLPDQEQGTLNGGIEALKNFWQSKGMNTEQMMLYDGSGLSPSNRITAEQLMTVLSISSQHPSFTLLLQSLPLAGYSGSLANHFRGSASEGLLRAKSGYLNGVRSYAGYTTMQNGNLAAFVIIANDYKSTPAAMRHKMLRLIDAITLHTGEALQ